MKCGEIWARSARSSASASRSCWASTSASASWAADQRRGVGDHADLLGPHAARAARGARRASRRGARRRAAARRPPRAAGSRAPRSARARRARGRRGASSNSVDGGSPAGGGRRRRRRSPARGRRPASATAGAPGRRAQVRRRLRAAVAASRPCRRCGSVAVAACSAALHARASGLSTRRGRGQQAQPARDGDAASGGAPAGNPRRRPPVAPDPGRRKGVQRRPFVAPQPPFIAPLDRSPIARWCRARAGHVDAQTVDRRSERWRTDRPARTIDWEAIERSPEFQELVRRASGASSCRRRSSSSPGTWASSCSRRYAEDFMAESRRTTA